MLNNTEKFKIYFCNNLILLGYPDFLSAIIKRIQQLNFKSAKIADIARHNG